MSERQQKMKVAESASSAPAAKAKVIFNPYAKKKSSTSVSAPDPAAVTDRPTNVRTNSAGSNPYIKQNLNGAQKQTQNQPKRRRPLPPVNESTTFSQAFGDTDPDARFGEEERAQQLAFDEALASTVGNNISTEPIVNDNATNNGITARDHHAMLKPHMLHISTRQRGNPIIAHIRNVPFTYSTMVPDYIFATTRCGLYLSLRYHNLHPNYIHRRIAELKSDFEYRLLLCHVDIDDNTSPLLFLNDLCVQNNLTLMLAWSEEEAARYLETVKAFDGKDASIIKGRDYTTPIDQVTHALGAVRSVNKTDASQLLTQFGSWKKLVGASDQELSVCPGMGPKKVRRLYQAFHLPFSKEMKKKRKERENEEKDKEVEQGGEKKTSNKTGAAEGSAIRETVTAKK